MGEVWENILAWLRHPPPIGSMSKQDISLQDSWTSTDPTLLRHYKRACQHPTEVAASTFRALLTLGNSLTFSEKCSYGAGSPFCCQLSTDHDDEEVGVRRSGLAIGHVDNNNNNKNNNKNSKKRLLPALSFSLVFSIGNVPDIRHSLSKRHKEAVISSQTNFVMKRKQFCLEQISITKGYGNSLNPPHTSYRAL